MTEMPETLLVPVDGSEGAGHAARFAARLAETMNRPVKLLFAFPASPMDLYGVPSEGAMAGGVGYFAPEEFEKLRDDSARRVFRAAREAIGESPVRVDEELLAGEPSEAILDYAEKVPGAMIVVGSRGLSGFKRVLLGSLSQTLVQHAHCPVTVVR